MARMFREFREIKEQDIERMRREQLERERQRQLDRERRARELERAAAHRAAEEAERNRFEALPPEAQRMELLEKEMKRANSHIEYLRHRLERLPKEIEEKKEWKKESDRRNDKFMEEEAQRYGRGFYGSERRSDLMQSHRLHMKRIDEDITKLENSIAETQLELESALIDYKYKEMEMSELARIAQMRNDATINQQNIPTVESVQAKLAAQQAAEKQQSLAQQQQVLLADLQKDLEKMNKLQQDLSNNDARIVEINEKIQRLNNRSQNLQTELSQATTRLYDDFLPTIDGRRPRTIQQAIDMHSKYVAYNANHGKAVETVEALAARALVLDCIQNGGHISQTNATPNTPVYTGSGVFGPTSKPLYDVKYGDSISFNKNDIVRDMTVQHIDNRFGMFNLEYSTHHSYREKYQLTNTPVNLVGKPLLEEIKKLKADFDRVSQDIETKIREQRKDLEFQKGLVPRIQGEIADLQKVIDEKQAAIDALQQTIDEKQAIINEYEQAQIAATQTDVELDINEFDDAIFAKQVEQDIELEEDNLNYDDCAKIPVESQEIADDAVYYDMCASHPDQQLMNTIKAGLARKCLADGREPTFVSQENLSVMYKIERGGNWTGIDDLSQLAHGDSLIIAKSELDIDAGNFTQINNVQNISSMVTGDLVIESPSEMISTIDFSQELEQMRAQTVETHVIGE